MAAWPMPRFANFNPQTGDELTAVLGFTYNFVNQSTQYQNGVDMHLDWATGLHPVPRPPS